MIRIQTVTPLSSKSAPAPAAATTRIDTAAAMRDGARMLGRAIVSGVAAALTLSAMTLALAGRAHAAPESPARHVSQLAPINAIASELFVAAGERLIRADIARTAVEVTVMADRVHYTSTRVYAVAPTPTGVLALPLTGDSTVEQVTVQGRNMHFEATGARNDAGYREDMLVDKLEQSRLTYALGALEGQVSITIEWSRPLSGSDVRITVPLKNTHDRWLPESAVRDADVDDSGCGGPPEPMMWTVHIDPSWQAKTDLVTDLAGTERSGDSSWFWYAGAADATPTSVELVLHKQSRSANNATIVAKR